MPTNVSDGTYNATYSYLANSPLINQITYRSNSTTRTVLGIPCVGPVAIIRKVAISIVAEALGGLGQEKVTCIGLIRATERGNVRHTLPDRGRGIVDGELFPEVFAFPVGRRAVDCDTCRWMGDADYIGGTGDIARGVLIEGVRGVGGRPEACATSVATLFG